MVLLNPIYNAFANSCPATADIFLSFIAITVDRLGLCLIRTGRALIGKPPPPTLAFAGSSARLLGIAFFKSRSK